jgi:hypothetical protein
MLFQGRHLLKPFLYYILHGREATAEDLADVFRKTTTAARKGRWRQADGKVINLE